MIGGTKAKYLYAGLMGAAVGVGGMFTFFGTEHTSSIFALNSSCIKQYPLTSHDLDCDTYDDVSSRLHNLNDKLKAVSDSYVAQGKADKISIWVRDLTTLQWASTNETVRFAPGSLLKLPLLVAYYRMAELQPALLDSMLVYTPSASFNSSTQDYFPPADPLVAGRSYKVSELIEHMIIHSDNDAAAMLYARIDPGLYEQTLIDLGIKIPGDNKNYDFITAKSYGSIFRQLYNASYLNREYSQKALDLLSRTDFVGLNAELPTSTVVAQKFGERTIIDESGTTTRELHDCGIIYKGERPYTLCIMTSGKSFNDLLAIIKDTSLLVYKNL